MRKLVTDQTKITTDLVLIKELTKQGIPVNEVEFCQDYAPAFSKSGKKIKGQSPYAKFYRHLNSDKRFMVVSQLPKCDADGVKLEAGWEKDGNKYVSKHNLFISTADSESLTIAVRNDQPDGRKAKDMVEVRPQIFLDGAEISCVLGPVLLDIDPLNENYLGNTLEWDFGICKRRVRLIEGRVLGSWIFTQDPHGSVKIKYNQTGDYKLQLGQFAVDDDTELIPAAVFASAEYPLTVADSATFYPGATAVDGCVIHYNNPSTWATIHDGAGTGFDYAGNYLYLAQFSSSQTDNMWQYMRRAITLFDISGLPADATITGVTVAFYGYGKADPVPWNIDVCVYASAPASNTALEAGDYDSLGTTELSNVITYADWLTTSPYWNTFTLNATGIALAQTAYEGAGILKLGLRSHTHDAHNSEPAYSSLKAAYLISYSSEGGAGYKPTLVVTYTVLVEKTSSDTGSGQDTAELNAVYELADTGAGVDIVSSLLAALVANDSGSGIDSAVFSAVFNLSDTGDGLDEIVELIKSGSFTPRKTAFDGYRCFIEQYVKNKTLGGLPWKLPDGTKW